MTPVGRWALAALVAAVAVTVAAAPTAGQAASNCTISVNGSRAKYNRCTLLTGTVSMKVYWNLTDTTLTAAFMSISTGWAGLAFSGPGQAMVAPNPPPVLAVIGLSTVAAPREASASVYRLLARNSMGVQRLPVAVAENVGYSNVAAFRSPAGLVVTFTRNVSAEPVIGGDAVNVLWAQGPLATGAPALQRHTARQAGVIRFGQPNVGASPGSVSPTPTSTATPAGADEDVCFPADATVEVVGRGRVAMADLHIGDVVAVAAGRTSRVYAFSHADVDAVTPFVELSTATSVRPLRLSPGHYLPVNGRLAAARTVAVGDVLVSAAGPAAVTAVSASTGVGLYNPHTVDGGLLVDGIRTSCYTTAVEPAVAAALLAPARWATAALGPRAGDWVEAVTAWGRSAAAALPSGRDVL
ncbi:hypothetical protein BU14_0333s0003 [Porphyra umbilicalis]|uniref:Hint domain-containing protein n=1 Tax=Porphyra umbilicalis TaxID=2786 RepID=A0A1X6NYB0_PORUM|nr:hypothetical protein BU14_0333s0003 [Porphyra umbilicalis]|eukprot:OSX73614.1 hypothetical protein BU14_0333s0003 [Porphyra umbilicalis]